MTEPSGKQRTSAAARLAALLILIGLGGCDNVEWGGIDLSVVPPPVRAEAPQAELAGAADRLPSGPLLYFVRRDGSRAEMVPVGEITQDGMAPIAIAGDPEEAGTRFIAAFLREGAEFTLFHRGRRAGTLIVESADVPTGDVCRRLPRARGNMELSGGTDSAGVFLAMARTQAPDGRALPGTPEVERRMQVMGPILAERALRARGAQLPNWATARRQVFPFPVSAARDLAFTSTFLVDDELQVGNDTIGYSMFIVYTPQAQSGYDTAYVAFTDYPRQGKAAPRVIDFLDWDNDGSPELLLEVFGTRDRWFEAVGDTGDGWERILEDRCDADGPAMAADTAAADAAAPAPALPSTEQPTVPPATPPAAPPADTTPMTQAGPPALPLPDIEPLIRLSIPGVRPDTTDRS